MRSLELDLNDRASGDQLVHRRPPSVPLSFGSGHDSTPLLRFDHWVSPGREIYFRRLFEVEGELGFCHEVGVPIPSPRSACYENALLDVHEPDLSFAWLG